MTTDQSPDIMSRAITAQQQGALQEAVTLYRQILSQSPMHGIALHNLGIVLLDMGHFAEGEACVRRGLLLDRDNPAVAESYRNVALKLAQAGHWEVACNWLQEASLRYPQDESLRSWLRRCEPRSYLAAEKYSPVQNQVLKRYSPREASAYVFTIDIVGSCNLRCPTCPVGNYRCYERPKGFMSEQLFTRILHKIEKEPVCSEPQIWLYNWGEPLLHPQIISIVDATSARGLPVYLSTNLNVKVDFEALLRAKPKDLKISVSAFQAENYERLHSRAKLSLLKNNLCALAQARDAVASDTHIWVSHHLYKSSLQDQEHLRQFCEELGFNYYPIAAFYQPLEKLLRILEGEIDDNPVLADLLEHPRSYLQRIADSKDRDYDCELRFNQTVINHDGRVALCCSVYENQNMLGVNFLDYSHAQLELMKYEHPMCATCHTAGLAYAPLKLR